MHVRLGPLTAALAAVLCAAAAAAQPVDNGRYVPCPKSTPRCGDVPGAAAIVAGARPSRWCDQARFEREARTIQSWDGKVSRLSSNEASIASALSRQADAYRSVEPAKAGELDAARFFVQQTMLSELGATEKQARHVAQCFAHARRHPDPQGCYSLYCDNEGVERKLARARYLADYARSDLESRRARLLEGLPTSQPDGRGGDACAGPQPPVPCRQQMDAALGLIAQAARLAASQVSAP